MDEDEHKCKPKLSLSEPAVGRDGEPRTALSERCLQNLLSQTIVKLREQSGVKALFDEDRVVAAASNEFTTHGFEVREDLIRAIFTIQTKR